MQEILSSTEIHQKIERLAHQVIEDTFEEKRIFVVGIKGNGSILAARIAKIISSNSSVETEVFHLEIDKEKPWSAPVRLSCPNDQLKDGYIILVDDVVNSGKAMQYALVEILQFPTKAIKTLTLVDRKHRRFPIKANFVGLSLSTTLKERVEVDFSEGHEKAYLV